MYYILSKKRHVFIYTRILYTRSIVDCFLRCGIGFLAALLHELLSLHILIAVYIEELKASV